MGETVYPCCRHCERLGSCAHGNDCDEIDCAQSPDTHPDPCPEGCNG